MIGFNLDVFVFSILVPNLIITIILVYLTLTLGSVGKVNIDGWMRSFNVLRHDLIKTSIVGFAFQAVLIPSVSLVVPALTLVRFATGLQLSNSVHNTAGMLLQTRVPLIIRSAKGSLPIARKHLVNAIKFSISFAIFSAIILMIIVLERDIIGLSMLSERIPTSLDMIWFGIYILSQLVINIFATVMRIVHLEEMFKVTVFVGVSFLSSIFLLDLVGISCPSLILAVIYTVVGMPVTLYYYVRARQAGVVWL